MREQVIFDREYLTIYFLSEYRLIHLLWRRYATTEEYREGLTFALNFVMKNGIVRWLANLKNMSAIAKSDREWVNREWFPRIFKSQLQKMAIVQSQDVFNRMAVTKIMAAAHAEQHFQVAYFDEREDALNWLIN